MAGAAVGHSVAILVREAAYGTAVGIAAAFAWYFSVTAPSLAKVADYHKK